MLPAFDKRSGGTISDMAEQGTLTYNDLLAFPDDGKRRELLDGELIVSPSPRLRHQEIVGRLYLSLGNHVVQQGSGRVYLGPTDILFSDRNVLVPDVLFVADERLGILTEKNIQGVPSLVIEVLSNPRIDRVRKRDIYGRFGVPEYWFVDPEADRVEIYHATDAGYGKPEIFEPGDTLEYPPLPRLQIDLTKLFAR